MAKKIPLQNGMFAIVDDEDYERCMEHIWSVGVISHKSGLQVRNVTLNTSLQRFVLEDVDDGSIVTFLNGDRLDFRKRNLIKTDWKGVSVRKKGWRNVTSKYKGVSWSKVCNKWTAQITVNGRKKHIGTFVSEHEAAKEYNKNAKKYFGEGAYQNVIGEDNSADTHAFEKTTKARRDGQSSIYKGVSLCERSKTKKWKAYIYDKNDKKNKYISSYLTEEEAARAYDKKARELFGDKAILNFPDEEEVTHG